MSPMLFIYEDNPQNFEPLSHLRPVTEIRCGTLSFREKAERMMDQKASLIVRRDLNDLCAEEFPALEVAGKIPEGLHLFLSSGTVLAEPVEISDKNEVLTGEDDTVVGFITDKLVGSEGLADVRDFIEATQDQRRRIPARRIRYPWEIFASLEQEVTRDFFGELEEGEIDSHAVVYGKALRVEKGARVEAGTVIDCRNGPVTIAEGAFTKGPNLIEGPCYIGPGTIVDSARIRAGTVLGPVCRVGGEVEASIFHGYVNKHHEGFMGHAYLGEWVNLGAMTTNSDLKNNYSDVKVLFNGESLSTGLMKFGCIIGDHTKTAIGTLIPTGTMIGIFANLFGEGPASKFIKSFSWGKTDVYDLEQLVNTTEKVMVRRKRDMNTALRERINTLHTRHTQDAV
ncbi:hypothetical protein GF359_00830 [candidate division WOR-3 bacterium]|uniref:Glucose-1-phosphate thymidylyltransferase n=1 Tax=candidate division WOR-3 bacterium TaxID=2052148 RepID=A0A9D5K7G1_UNCW3|nr:hypothetical protein [candidate division WOR-3 bacterium]MBD3363738.1 hypothetical protein [candidate division WOR-3 bacterium]